MTSALLVDKKKHLAFDSFLMELKFVDRKESAILNSFPKSDRIVYELKRNFYD